MRSVDDLSTKATIRDAAMNLFAARGFHAVTVRDIASAARVSPGLVNHHFGSKAGLQQAINDHVCGLVEQSCQDALDPELIRLVRAGDFDAAAASTQNSAMNFLKDSSFLAYLRQLIAQNDPAATDIVRRWLTISVTLLSAWDEGGHANAGAHPTLRAAVLFCHDMGVALLREQIKDVLDLDPFQDGAQVWAQETAALLEGALWRTTGASPDVDAATPATEPTTSPQPEDTL